MYYKDLHIILLVFTTHPKEYTSSKTSAKINWWGNTTCTVRGPEWVNQSASPCPEEKVYDIIIGHTTAETARSLEYSSWQVGNTSWRWLDIYCYPNNQCYIEGKFRYCCLFCQFNVLLPSVSVNVINACFIINLIKQTPRYCSKAWCHSLYVTVGTSLGYGYILGLHPKCPD